MKRTKLLIERHHSSSFCRVKVNGRARYVDYHIVEFLEELDGSIEVRNYRVKRAKRVRLRPDDHYGLEATIGDTIISLCDDVVKRLFGGTIPKFLYWRKVK